MCQLWFVTFLEIKKKKKKKFCCNLLRFYQDLRERPLRLSIFVNNKLFKIFNVILLKFVCKNVFANTDKPWDCN